jgi:hypothetical protein
MDGPEDQTDRQTYAIGVIEQHDDHFLIATFRDRNDVSRLWQFPRGIVKSGESPEAAMRRVAKENLAVTIEIVLGQPPLLAEVEGKQAELRCLFCSLSSGTPTSGPYAEIQWIPKAHLREYDFDAPSKLVVDWLLTRSAR